MALVGRGARRRRFFEREAAVGAGVVDLPEGAVFVLADQRLVGAEEHIRSARGDAEEADRSEIAAVFTLRAVADQLRPAPDVLVGVRDTVRVPVDQGFFGRKEGAAVVGHEEAVDAAFGVGGRRFAVGTARGADQRSILHVVPVHLRAFGVVVGRDLRFGQEGHPFAVEGNVDALEGPPAVDGGDVPGPAVAPHVEIAAAGETLGPLVQLLGRVEVDFARFQGDRVVAAGPPFDHSGAHAFMSHWYHFRPAPGCPASRAVVAVAGSPDAGRDPLELVCRLAPAEDVDALVGVVRGHLVGRFEEDFRAVRGDAGVVDPPVHTGVVGRDVVGPVPLDVHVEVEVFVELRAVVDAVVFARSREAHEDV